MKNIALDGTTILQLDADGTNGALDAAADRDVLRNDTTFDLRAIADQKIRGTQITFDTAEDLGCAIAFDVAKNRHAGADARAHSRFDRGLFDDRALPDPLPNQDCARSDGDRDKYDPPGEKGETYCV